MESSSKGALAFTIKYAYFDVRGVMPSYSFYCGVVATPWIGFEEDNVREWRVIRKVACDYCAYGSSAGVGGKFANGLVDHHLTFTNGAGFANRENSLSGKDITYRPSVFPLVGNDEWGGISVNAVGYRLAEVTGPDDGDDKNPILAYGGLLGLSYKFVNFGAGYFQKAEGEDNVAAGTEKVEGSVTTAYVSVNLVVTPWMSVHAIVRYDAYEPDKDQHSDERTLILGGAGLKFFDASSRLSLTTKRNRLKRRTRTTRLI